MNNLTKEEQAATFEHILRRLGQHRNTVALWIDAEHVANEFPLTHNQSNTEELMKEIDTWANALAQNAWLACGLKDSGKDCPTVGPLNDTSLGDIQPLPPVQRLVESGFLNTLILLHITSSKQYSARSRAFLLFLGTPNETAIAATLKDPSKAIAELNAKKNNPDAEAAAATKAQEEKNKTWRNLGIGVGAVAGGVLIGVTGGLAAPLVGAGVATVLGWVGVGGTAAGVLASGLAGSSVVCGALFGAYGARTTAEMVDRHTKEVKDLKVVPVKELKDTLAVRLCISGWLDTPADVTEPWTVFEGDDTYALQWEVNALQKLSTALVDLFKTHAMKYVKREIIKRTIFATLLAGLSPIAWLKFGKIIDNPWMNAKSLALKTGAVLGNLLASRAFGSRPVTLTGYSLGALVIHTALLHLASLPPSQTAHLIQDVYLFGTPAPADEASWTSIRRVVAGRLVNGYSSAETDYVLAIVCRISMPSAAMGVGIAGLQEVPVMGVENVYCEGVEGHLKWRGMVGRCMEQCEVPGVNKDAVARQVEVVAGRIEREMEEYEKDGLEEDLELMEKELTR